MQLSCIMGSLPHHDQVIPQSYCLGCSSFICPLLFPNGTAQRCLQCMYVKCLCTPRDFYWPIRSSSSNCLCTLPAVSIPTVLDPGLAPPGKHAVHAYMAGNEPYSLWEGLERGSREYEELKEQRTQVLWNALERIIPDIRARAEVTLPASPLTHEMFNRRHRGSYGPGWRAGEGTFPGCTTPIKDLLRCGDSTLPGLGVPAVAASGMHAANTLVPVWQHLKFVEEMQSKGFIVDRFKDSL
eukprot:TRINITY_DN7073_c0_g1_i1.p1 TRINITY_DN7073_c0_g1~~TRINITY_DN7073_c0_g1_i1.p1  ORF type:complete len:240 (+),score=22.65 TRINITY_DN7073_c0_g1_i1:341-1060(+)